MLVLKVDQLTKKYGKKHVLKDFSFEINEGDLIGLVGPNGAGKSTLMRAILSLEEVDSGEVTVKGISNKNSEFFKHVTFLPSDNYLYTQLTGYDHLAFVASIYKLEKNDIKEVIDLIGIRSYVNDPVKSYSYGMRQHLLIALSILTKPQLILMDEPFNGLDPTSIIELKQLIRTLQQRNISIVVSTHSLDILEDLTSTIWFIKEGELIQNLDMNESDSIYEIEVEDSFNLSLESLMEDSHLPFTIIENRIFTSEDQAIESYLAYLLENKVKIKSFNRSKKKLEEMYKSFYEV